MSKKRTRTLASVTLISLVLSTSTLEINPVHAAVGRVTRVSGADRYETAAQVAITNWSNGTDNVVLVSGEGYADAVSASSLAKQLNAPILLTNSKTLNSDAKSALDTLKPQNIYIVGGNASISQSVRNILRNYGYNLIELQGSNRYETNTAVAKKMVELGVSPENVLLASGEGFSDALSVAPVAAAKGQILLLGTNDISAMKSTINFVKSNNSKVTVVGTSNVISDYIYDALNAVDRVDGGASRFETNINVLNKYDSFLKSDKLFIANASGDGYADALVASSLAGKTTSPLVLVDTYGSNYTNNALNYIKSKATTATDLNVIGGSGVVSESTVYDINNAISQKSSSSSSRTVTSIEPISLNQMKIHFDTAIDEDSAEDVTNYKIDGTQLTKLDDNGIAQDENGAVASQIDDDTVLITFANPRKQYDNVTVTVKRGVLTEDREDTIDEFEQSVTFSDTTPPTLKKVSVEGNSQLTVEFSEAVNMKSINDLKGKFKIDGHSISNYGVNTEYSEIKDCVKVNNDSYGLTGTWANKVVFYLDSSIESGNHTLTVSEGDGNKELLSDAGGFTVKETSEDFDVDRMTSEPVVRSVEEVASGKINITFDRPMDIRTVKDLSNYEINDKSLSSINGASIETDDDDTVVKLKHISDGTIKTGSNILFIDGQIRDAFGNKLDDDIRKSFDDIKDETKPTVDRVTVVDSETILVKFNKDVDYDYATSRSNYKLKDNNGLDITDHIKEIYSASGESDTGNTDAYYIKLYRYNPDDSDDDWRLNSSKYMLTIENIIDTASTPNTMEDSTYTVNGNDDVAPRGVGIYARLRGSSGSSKDKVVIYFSEPMDTSTITSKNNFKFIDGEGETRSLPVDTNISVGSDDKSAILEFPSSYYVRTDGKAITGSSNEVIAVIVFNAEDEEGNLLSSVAFSNGNKIDVAENGAKVRSNALRLYHDGNDLKADIRFNKAIDNAVPSDFTIGGIKPNTTNIHGDTVTLVFKEDGKATDDEKASHPITYANGKVNEDPTKIELVKSQGENARLEIVSTDTVDETGARVSRDENGNPVTLSDDQATIYDYEAAPKTTCSDDTEADYWTVTKDANGAKVYMTFDSLLDPSDLRTDDFTFVGNNGTYIKPDSAKIDGQTIIFSFDNDNKYYNAFNGTTLDIRISSSTSLRNMRDADGNYAYYEPSSKDLRKRTINITESTPIGQVDLSTVTCNTVSIPLSTIVTFKLNVTDPANYNIKVKGVDAKFDSTTKTFAATISGSYTPSQFTASDFIVTRETALEGAALVDAVGPENNGKTQFSLSGVAKVNTSDTFKYIISTTGSAVPTPKVGDNLSSWTSVVDGDTVSVANGIHIGIAEVDSNGTVVRFIDKTAVSISQVDTLQGVTLVDAVGLENNGKTQFSLSGVTKVNTSDIFKYTISATGNAVPTPNVGDNLSSWTSVVDGDTVSVANGTHIAIAEVDSNGKAVRFVDKAAVVKDYVAATSGTITAGNAADLTTTMAYKTGSLVINVDGTDSAHTFTVSLNNHAIFSDVSSLASAIGLATNSTATSLNNVANVTITNGKLVITSKSTGTTSTVSVSASGTNAADVLKLTGFTSSEVVTGTAGAN